MKRTFAIAAALLLTLTAVAQNIQDIAAQATKALEEAEDVKQVEVKQNYWTKGSTVDLGFVNTSLSNWAAGGYNTISLKSSLDAKATYKKDLTSWSNRLQLEYGFIYSNDKPFIQKNNDRIYLESKFGHKPTKDSKWNLTASFDFKSQFSNSYTYVTPGVENPTYQDWKAKRTLKSGFLAPAYTNLALGIDWAAAKWISFNIAPVTGGFTIARDEALRKSYSMELKDEYKDSESLEGYMYKSARFEFGAQLKTDIKLNINKSVNYETQVVLFSNYLKNPQNLRVAWDNQVSWQLAKFFRVSLKTWMIYDPYVLITNDKDIDLYPDGIQRVQFKESLSINFTYTF